MRSEEPVRCAKCYLRIAPYELRRVHRKTTYHQHCFIKLVREGADPEKTTPSGTGLAAKKRGQHA
jgi:hypothetical protein